MQQEILQWGQIRKDFLEHSIYILGIMTARILSAKPVVEVIKQDLILRCQQLKQKGFTPTMSVVLVGNNPASLSYIRNKQKMCEEIGANFSLQQLPETIGATEFLLVVDKLNKDPAIHGIIIQLPVSEELQQLDLPNLVVPHKDIDGFHGKNTQLIYAGTTQLENLMPCTPKGIINLLRFYGVQMDGKHAVVIGRSLIVGKPLSMLLTNFNATVTLAHSRTPDLKHFTRQADIVIAAIGRGNMLDASYFDPARQTVVIDVGMNSVNGKLTGDVDRASAASVVAGLTPVPGGVGPMTVIGLIENLITASELQLKEKAS
jgi:methylenetetrahydrofolate dehydrogenase (NADP+) / methenyltetrahydrofolate cyclohydrolase